MMHFIDICGEIEAGNMPSGMSIKNGWKNLRSKNILGLWSLRVPPEWWDEHLARCNNAEKGIKSNHVRFIKQGPKNFDDLDILFDKFHVSGATTTCPDDVSSGESSDEDVDEKDENSPFFQLYKSTCSKIETAAEKISTNCGVQEKIALMYTSTLLIVKPDLREVFSSLEMNEGRFNLFEREHEMEMNRCQ
ncbi:hypothetical protein PVAP13_2KG286167 [Panicum virgatum]|uniref:Uncharacterized protein n=1 Tax=Panicum virgatum TaxID=38727 RepID=A0A8T0WBY2_PANVG|nr:hypothetical protein PVAP13_2KG286167 [Panicum virgatum]